MAMPRIGNKTMSTSTKNKIRKPSIFFISPTLGCSLCLIVSAQAPSAKATFEFKNDFNFAQRSRYASILEDDNAGKAASLLVRLNLKTEWSEAISSTLEMDSVTSFYNNEHNDGTSINTKPYFPDPEGSEINQAFLTLNRETLKLNIGRQRINFDDQRFIGGNGFWQNEQTFDAFLARQKIAQSSLLTYVYLSNVNRIYGEQAGKLLPPTVTAYTYQGSTYYYPPQSAARPVALWGDHKHHSHLARVEWNEWDYTQWVAYFYDIKNLDLPSDSNKTAGVSFSLNYKFSALKYHLRLETAAQERTVNFNDARLPYYLADSGITLNAYELSGRYEILAAKNNIPFITPLGSAHDFQGWADQFVNTPASGIKDASLNIVWRSAPFKIEGRYHTFLNGTNNQTLGRELDISFIVKPIKKHNLTLGFAQFESANTDLKNTDPKKNSRIIFLDYSYNL
jgi:hypothetical protein